MHERRKHYESTSDAEYLREFLCGAFSHLKRDEFEEAVAHFRQDGDVAARFHINVERSIVSVAHIPTYADLRYVLASVGQRTTFLPETETRSAKMLIVDIEDINEYRGFFATVESERIQKMQMHAYNAMNHARIWITASEYCLEGQLDQMSIAAYTRSILQQFARGSLWEVQEGVR